MLDDDEDGGMPIEPILEPKDPYVFRPLPYLIGSAEFMEDDYVGLRELMANDGKNLFFLENFCFLLVTLLRIR